MIYGTFCAIGFRLRPVVLLNPVFNKVDSDILNEDLVSIPVCGKKLFGVLNNAISSKSDVSSDLNPKL